MNNKKTFNITFNVTFNVILFILMVFFTLQLLSHLFSTWGEANTNAKTMKFFEWSTQLMPMDAESVYKYGYALLFGNDKDHDKAKDKKIILKSIQAFEKATDQNVLFYMGYYCLGKAFLLYDFPNSPYFEQGVMAFKRAALIRGNKNRDIAIDTLKLFLSQWPLLKNQDKQFCRQLLEKFIVQMNENDFNSILEFWRLYCRDIDFFTNILKTYPQYYLNVARELGRMEINLTIRQDFLARYEVYYLEWLKKMLQKYQKESENRLELLKYLRRISNVDGYYRIVKNSNLNEKEYLDFKKGLNLYILQLLFAQEAWSTDPGKKKEIEQYILAHFNEHLSEIEIESFVKFLKDYYFVGSQDFKAFYIKQLAHFKLEYYDQVIEDSETFSQSLSFIQREQINDYIGILTLLSDAYFKNKLMSQAMSILEKIEKISPGLLGTYWRMMKIESITGDTLKTVRPETAQTAYAAYRSRNFQKVSESRFIEPVALETHKTVYFIDSGEIVIRITDQLKDLMKSMNLFQVFIDGKIYYEAYISQLKNEDNVIIPFEKNAATCEVAVKIISGSP